MIVSHLGINSQKPDSSELKLERNRDTKTNLKYAHMEQKHSSPHPIFRGVSEVSWTIFAHEIVYSGGRRIT